MIDADGRISGYQNLLITDGSAIPANPGVNPSLTITALAEHTLSTVPAKPGATLPAPGCHTLGAAARADRDCARDAR